MSKGIGFSVFEFRGKTKKKLFEYRSSPEKMDMGIETLDSKFGFEIKKHSARISKNMRY